jgi:MFS family permease
VASVEPRSPKSSAAYRNLGLYLCGQGLSNVGTFSQMLALSLLVLAITGSGFALGVTMSVQAIPYLVLSPWAGPLLDRVPLRRLMMVTALVGALQASTLAALAVTDRISLPVVIVLAFVLGCVQVIERPAVQAGEAQAPGLCGPARRALPVTAPVVEPWRPRGTVAQG